jgi:precorrin-2/cobalt-factor-2 C20-methyltransferase
MTGRLVGVGVGPGDPELVTVRALRAFREADEIFVPVAESGEVGRAESVVRAYADPTRIRRLPFALSDDTAARQANWDRAGAEVAGVVAGGGVAAFATIGDPSVYSTFSYLAATVRDLVGEVEVETVPGITAMQDLAARAGVSLVEGGERLALLPLAAGPERAASALAAYDTVVCYKGGRHLPELLDVLRAAGRLDLAVYGARLGLAGETVRRAADLPAEPGPYLSTVIALPERRRRGGSGGLKERSGSPPANRGSGGLKERSGSPLEDLPEELG